MSLQQPKSFPQMNKERSTQISVGTIQSCTELWLSVCSSVRRPRLCGISGSGLEAPLISAEESRVVSCSREPQTN